MTGKYIDRRINRPIDKESLQRYIGVGCSIDGGG